MRKIYLSLTIVCVALALMSWDASAQVRYVDVAPGLGTLNDCHRWRHCRHR